MLKVKKQIQRKINSNNQDVYSGIQFNNKQNE